MHVEWRNIFIAKRNDVTETNSVGSQAYQLMPSQCKDDTEVFTDTYPHRIPRHRYDEFEFE